MSYSRMSGFEGPRRAYEITLGLIDADGVYRWPIEAVQEHGAWMVQRVTDDLPYLSGVFRDGTTSRAGRGPDGEPQMQSSPCLSFAGTVSVARMADAADADVVVLLDELARRLATALNQRRVSVSYRDSTWQLERDEPPAA